MPQQEEESEILNSPLDETFRQAWEQVSKPLFDGSETSQLSFMLMALELMTRNKFNSTDMENIIKFINMCFPGSPSWTKIWNYVEGFIPEQKYYITCPTHCCISEQHYPAAAAALQLKEWRCKVCGKNWTNTQYNLYCYIPIIPRLKHWMEDEHFCQLLTYINSRKKEDLSDIMDGELWESVTAEQWNWSKPGNLGFMFALDGKRKKGMKAYNFVPLLVSLLNLPPYLRTNPKYLMPVGIIPGGKEPGDVTPYLEPFHAEMKLLHTGITLGNFKLNM